MKENVLYLERKGDNLWVVPFHDFIAEKREETGSANYRDWFPKEWDWMTIFYEALEYDFCDGYSLVDTEQELGFAVSTLIIRDLTDYSLWYDVGYLCLDLLEETLINKERYPLYHL